MLNFRIRSFHRRNLSVLLSLLLILSLSPGLASCGKENPQEAVQLWAAENNSLYQPLAASVGEYNHGLTGRNLLSVSIRSFPTEEEMISALSSGSPDLILCSHYRQDALEQMDLMVDIAPAANLRNTVFTEDIAVRFPACGHGFFPVGSDVLLLLFSESVFPSDPVTSFSSLISAAQTYSSETGRPYFTVDSFSALFCQLLLSEKKEFHAMLSADLRDPVFLSLWNELASLSYDGAMVAGSAGGAALIRAGVLPCSIVSSSTAAGMTTDRITVFPGSEKAHVSECYGIVSLCHPSRLRSAGAFLHWLFDSDRLISLALHAGLIPAADSTHKGSGILEQLLLSLEKDSSGFFPFLSSDYYKNSSSFERYFRKVVSFLY